MFKLFESINVTGKKLMLKIEKDTLHIIEVTSLLLYFL